MSGTASAGPRAVVRKCYRYRPVCLFQSFDDGVEMLAGSLCRWLQLQCYFKISARRLKLPIISWAMPRFR